MIVESMMFGNYNAYQPIGARYNEVQAAVNGGNAYAGRVYTIKAGDNLSGIAAKYGTSYQVLA